MHMSDALLSPAVGGTMWAATAGLLTFCSGKIRKQIDDQRIPLMGVAGAFVFAAQMINFTIPGTGSSGHLGGGLLLAILLGPYAAFLVMASVLTVQALFFGDGGLLALGCNIFNLGFFPCLIAYPLIFQPIAASGLNNPARLNAGIVLAAVAGLQLGAFGVVLETTLSGLTELPFLSFTLMMLPIHMAIGIVEGLATTAVISFLRKTQPEILTRMSPVKPSESFPLRRVVAGLAIAAALTGGILSWFASQHPDGLEWAIAKVTGSPVVEAPGHSLHAFLRQVQDITAFLPDYGFRKKDTAGQSAGETALAEAKAADSRPDLIDTGTTTTGLVGGAITCAVAALLGLALKKRHPKA